MFYFLVYGQNIDVRVELLVLEGILYPIKCVGTIKGAILLDCANRMPKDATVTISNQQVIIKLSIVQQMTDMMLSMSLAVYTLTTGQSC